MSIDYCARFDSVPLDLPGAISRLACVLANSRICFGESVARMVSHGGWPTVDVSDSRSYGVPVERLSEVSTVARDWWGVSLSCVSLPLTERLGLSDAAEVDFLFFPASDTQLSLMYIENGRAHRDRLTNEDSARELCALQMQLCANFGFRLSLYDEEDIEVDSPLVSIDEVQARIRRAADGPLECSAVVSTACMNMARACQLAGPNAKLVQQSTTGHILFPLMVPHRTASTR